MEITKGMNSYGDRFFQVRITREDKFMWGGLDGHRFWFDILGQFAEAVREEFGKLPAGSIGYMESVARRERKEDEKDIEASLPSGTLMATATIDCFTREPYWSYQVDGPHVPSDIYRRLERLRDLFRLDYETQISVARGILGEFGFMVTSRSVADGGRSTEVWEKRSV